jgi:hypothetical protein
VSDDGDEILEFILRVIKKIRISTLEKELFIVVLRRDVPVRVSNSSCNAWF